MEKCLGRLVLLGESHLRAVIRQYVEHYHSERNHQGLDNELLPYGLLGLSASGQHGEQAERDQAEEEQEVGGQ